MTRSALDILFILGVLAVGRPEVHKGTHHVTEKGESCKYFLDNNPQHAFLLVDVVSDSIKEELLNVTYSKVEDEIRILLLGIDTLRIREEDELEVTKIFLDTSCGRSLPDISDHVFEETGVSGKEDDAMMLLHQIAIVSHNFHEGKFSRRRKRSFFDHHETDKELVNEFSEEVVKLCEGLNKHGGCSKNLAVAGSSNKCNSDWVTPEGTEGARQFTAEDISRGCYGLCGPWCRCWEQVCGDCCWHHGCYKHDVLCEDGYNNFKCLSLKGVFGSNIRGCGKDQE